jgi:hypothetical protein
MSTSTLVALSTLRITAPAERLPLPIPWPTCSGRNTGAEAVTRTPLPLRAENLTVALGVARPGTTDW